ncbi:acyl-ACP--UDP-N-acetylglucosamine O-acyltransferase [bacterium]|nr:acyl-ACP--UDP-N-acetylglucosamine O-acyltransferase [bacterium]
MREGIHPTALIADGAELAPDVRIGPYCVIGEHVRIAAGAHLISHVSVAGRTQIGAGVTVHPFCVLGSAPQDLKYRGEPTELVIGEGCTLREQVTMHVGTPTGRGVTRVGSGGLFMVGAHVGHDCIVGDKVVFANNATLGGSAVIGDFVNIGGLAAVHQLGRVGRYAFIGGGAPLVGDVIPFGMVDNHGRLAGLNLVGLKRRGFSRSTIHRLRALFDLLFHGEGVFEGRVNRAVVEFADCPEAMEVLDFIQADARRGLCTPGRRI